VKKEIVHRLRWLGRKTGRARALESGRKIDKESEWRTRGEGEEVRLHDEVGALGWVWWDIRKREEALESAVFTAWR
jgi:hypothetical protein